jgi:thymidylate synthase (FAD)
LDFEVRDARLQDQKNRQNSVDLDMADEYEAGLQDRWGQMQQRVIDESKIAYSWAIENGIAKEQARAVLPEGNTQSRMYMNGTIRSWIHYIDLRSANGTQKEHMEIARECAKALEPVFPMIKEFVHEL